MDDIRWLEDMEATLRLAQSCLSDAHLMYKKLGSKKVKLVLLSSSLKIRRMEPEVSKIADRIADLRREMGERRGEKEASGDDG